MLVILIVKIGRDAIDVLLHDNHCNCVCRTTYILTLFIFTLALLKKNEVRLSHYDASML